MQQFIWITGTMFRNRRTPYGNGTTLRCTPASKHQFQPCCMICNLPENFGAFRVKIPRGTVTYEQEYNRKTINFTHLPIRLHHWIGKKNFFSYINLIINSRTPLAFLPRRGRMRCILPLSTPAIRRRLYLGRRLDSHQDEIVTTHHL